MLAAADSTAGSNAGSSDAAAWCTQTRWRVQLVPAGRLLSPANLFDAMTATRQRRLG
jgi:hypothetical protein